MPNSFWMLPSIPVQVDGKRGKPGATSGHLQLHRGAGNGRNIVLLKGVIPLISIDPYGYRDFGSDVQNPWSCLLDHFNHMKPLSDMKH